MLNSAADGSRGCGVVMGEWSMGCGVVMGELGRGVGGVCVAVFIVIMSARG